MSTEILARLQFAFTTSFHYIFPPMSIGLGLILVIIEGTWLRTGNDLYKRMAHFWVKVFALIFGLGVATGIVLEFEFGTNWATYSRYVGDIFGSALAAEGIFAFFLESGFLALLVFGWHKVSKGWHFFSTCMVALGSTFSAVWIIVANSWMQTPAGYKIIGEGMEARAQITDFKAMVFNPSSMDRLTHSVLGAWITGAFLVISVAAYYLRNNRHQEFGRATMKIGLTVAMVACVAQIFVGHRSAQNVAKNQPSKFAAMEGHFETGPLALVPFGFVDEKNQRVIGPSIPGMGSWLLNGNEKTPVQGINDIPEDARPMTQPVFQLYHAMIGIGIFLTLLSFSACIMWWRGTLWTSRRMLGLLIPGIALAHLANQFGWFTAELGRQPWIVYGMLRTSDGLSKVVKANQVLFSLILFAAIYALLGFLFFYLLDRKIKAGPDDPSDDPPLLKEEDKLGATA
jgi:cytochrome d ubiquinol oxidase subunit I